MGKKKQYNQFAEIAATLPVVMVETHEIHFRTGAEIKLEDGIDELDGVPLQNNEMISERYPVLIAVNHKKKLKRLMRSGGPDAVAKYIAEVKINDKLKNQSNG